MLRACRIGCTIAVLTLGFSVAASSARATTIDDPLHGFCGTSASSSSCSDDNTITPFSTLGSFGFYASPDALTGTDWLVAILVPTSFTNDPASLNFSLSETPGAGNTAKSGVSANLVTGTWTAGDLADFLTGAYGTSAANTTPANPFSAFTVENDSSVSGFYAYVADLGAAELFKQADSSSPDAPLLTLKGSLAPGMEITSFLLGAHPGDKQPNVATAPSGVLLANGDCCSVSVTDTAVPEPTTILLLGTGIGFVATRIRRRSR
jgi:hypothetical protein